MSAQKFEEKNIVTYLGKCEGLVAKKELKSALEVTHPFSREEILDALLAVPLSVNATPATLDRARMLQARILGLEIEQLEAEKKATSPSKRTIEHDKPIIRKERMLQVLLMGIANPASLQPEDVLWAGKNLVTKPKPAIADYLKGREYLTYLAQKGTSWLNAKQLNASIGSARETLSELENSGFGQLIKSLREKKDPARYLDQIETSLQQDPPAPKFLPLDVIELAESKVGAGLSLDPIIKERARDLDNALKARWSFRKYKRTPAAKTAEREEHYAAMMLAAKAVMAHRRELLSPEINIELSKEAQSSEEPQPLDSKSVPSFAALPSLEKEISAPSKEVEEEKNISFYQKECEKLLASDEDVSTRVDQLKLLQARIHYLEAKKIGNSAVEVIRKERMVEALLMEIWSPTSIKPEDLFWAGDILANKLNVQAYLRGRHFLRLAQKDPVVQDDASAALIRLDQKRDAQLPKLFYVKLKECVQELKAGKISEKLEEFEKLLKDEKQFQRYLNNPGSFFSPLDIIALVENEKDGAGIKVEEEMRQKARALVDGAAVLDANICLEKSKVVRPSEKAKYLADMMKAGEAIEKVELLDLETSLALAESSADSVLKWKYLKPKLADIQDSKNGELAWRFLRTALKVPHDVMSEEAWLTIKKLVAIYLKNLREDLPVSLVSPEDSKKMHHYKSVYAEVSRACVENPEWLDLEMSLALVEHAAHLQDEQKWRFLQKAMALHAEGFRSQGWLSIQKLALEYLDRLREDLTLNEEDQEKREKYNWVCIHLSGIYLELDSIDLETGIGLVEHLEDPMLKSARLMPALPRIAESKNSQLVWRFLREAKMTGQEIWGPENWLKIQKLPFEHLDKLQKDLPNSLDTEENREKWREYKSTYGQMLHAYNVYHALGVRGDIVDRAELLDTHVTWLNYLEMREYSKVRQLRTHFKKIDQMPGRELLVSSDELTESDFEVGLPIFLECLKEVEFLVDRKSDAKEIKADAARDLEEIAKRVTQRESQSLSQRPQVLPELSELMNWIHKPSGKLTREMLDQYSILSARVSYLYVQAFQLQKLSLESQQDIEFWQNSFERDLMFIKNPAHLKPADVLWAGEMLAKMSGARGIKGRELLHFLVVQKQEPYSSSAQRKLAQFDCKRDQNFDQLLRGFVAGGEAAVIKKLKEFEALLRSSEDRASYLESSSAFSALDIVRIAESKEDGAGIPLSEETREYASDLMRACEAHIAWRKWEAASESSKGWTYLSMIVAAKGVKNQELLGGRTNAELDAYRSGLPPISRSIKHGWIHQLSEKEAPELTSGVLESKGADAKRRGADDLWAIPEGKAINSPQKKGAVLDEHEKELVEQLKKEGVTLLAEKIINAGLPYKNQSNPSLASPMKMLRLAGHAGLKVLSPIRLMAQDFNNVKEATIRWSRYQGIPEDNKEERDRCYQEFIELAQVVKFTFLLDPEMNAEIVRFNIDKSAQKLELSRSERADSVQYDPTSNLLGRRVSAELTSLSSSSSSVTTTTAPSVL